MERLIYIGTYLRIGQFSRTPAHPKFHGPLITGGGPIVVFPRTSVIITLAGKNPVVADPNRVMFYNGCQVYSRDNLSERGDRCEWYRFDEELVADAVRPYDAWVDDHPSMPFRYSHGPCDTRIYLRQRLMVKNLLENPYPNPLFIEESALQILKTVVESCYRHHRIYKNNEKYTCELDIVKAIQKFLAVRFNQTLTLKKIASHLNYSAYHLCRVFRKHTGMSIHQYLKQLRLRISLEYVIQPGTDLTNLALDMGFSSHSHFTEAFRRTFGAPPSVLRNKPGRQIREIMGKISIA